MTARAGARWRAWLWVGLVATMCLAHGAPATAQTSAPNQSAPNQSAPSAKPAPATPETKAPPSATPPAPAPSPVTPGSKAPAPGASDTKSPPASTPTPNETTAPKETPAPKDKPDADSPGGGKPGNTEIEPHGSPGVPQNATTESVNVSARPLVQMSGRSSYDDAFKSIKASLETLKKTMEKAGLKPGGHPITIFSEPDDKGFKFKAAVPLAAKPDNKPDLGPDVSLGESPSGKAIKFQHRGAYEDIDSTYDVITAYLDAKGLTADNPYIEEYLTDLTTPDDPNLQVDIYIFIKP